MRAASVLTATCLLLVPFASTTGIDAGAGQHATGDVAPKLDQPQITWYGSDGAVAWSASLAEDPGTGRDGDEGARPLHAPPWFPLLPEVEVDLVEGGTVGLHDYSGNVLLLSFWATWCAPCVEELPWLQRLYEAERDRGIAVLTVNMLEADDVALGFARTHDLRMPIARYSGSLDEVLRVRSLPTLFVVDRQRRIRARFDAKTGNVESQIAQLARGLLDEKAEPGPEIARVLGGRDAFAVGWSRAAVATVRGLAVLSGADPDPSMVMAATGWEVVGYGAAGKLLGEWRSGRGVDRLRPGEDERGAPTALGFRPASDRVVPIALDGDAGAAWRASAPVFDLQVEPAQEGAAPTVLLATLAGLERVGLDGSAVASRQDLGLVVQVGRSAGEPVALGGDGRLSWLDGDLGTVRTSQAAPGSRVLVSPPGAAEGLGVAPASVDAVAVGQLLSGGGTQVALAVGGQLTVLDASSGRERFRAEWPDIAALAAGDLDGDGRDELFVGSGKRVTALRATADSTSP
jgi:thiol-disulfide isomerase/thioredoxin